MWFSIAREHSRLKICWENSGFFRLRRDIFKRKSFKTYHISPFPNESIVCLLFKRLPYVFECNHYQSIIIGAINSHFVFVCSARRRQPKHYANNMVASEVLYNCPMATSQGAWVLRGRGSNATVFPDDLNTVIGPFSFENLWVFLWVFGKNFILNASKTKKIILLGLWKPLDRCWMISTGSRYGRRLGCGFPKFVSIRGWL